MKPVTRQSQHVVLGHAAGKRHFDVASVAATNAERDGERVTAFAPLNADEAGFTNRHFSGSIGLRTSDGSGPDRAVERASRRPVRACALILAATLALASCEADEVAARATLTEWGYHGVAILPAPTLDRPCRWSEPFAVRFRATREDGAVVSGTMCASDETTSDARLLVDAEGSR